MKPTEKLEADKSRHAKAVQQALERTQLLRTEAEKLNAFVSAGQQDEYVTKLQKHHVSRSGLGAPAAQASTGARNATGTAAPTTAAAAPGAISQTLLPPTQTLLASVKANKTRVQQAAVDSLHVQRAALEAEYKQVEKEQETLLDRRYRKKTSLTAALAEDERLERLGPHAVVQDFLAEGRTLLFDDSSLPRQPIPQGRDAKPAAADTGSEESDGSEGTGSDGSYDSEEESDGSGSEGSSYVSGDSGDTGEGEGTDWQAEIQQTLARAKKTRRRRKQGDPATQVPIRQAAITGQLIRLLRSGRVEEAAQKLDLSPLVEVLKDDVTEQEQALHDLRTEHSVVATRLNWATRRPVTYQRNPTATAKQRAITSLCKDMANELINLAMDVVDMRPSLAQVQAEVQEYKAHHALRLHDIARHIADSVLKDCVDELIAEASKEVSHLDRSADWFACGLLVEAVAASQGRYGIRVDGQETVRTRLQQAAEQQEVQAAADAVERKRLAAERDAAVRAARAATEPTPTNTLTKTAERGSASVRTVDRASGQVTAPERGSTSSVRPIERGSGAVSVPVVDLGPPDEEDIIMQDALSRQKAVELLTQSSLRLSSHPPDSPRTRMESLLGSQSTVYGTTQMQEPVYGPAWDATARSLPPRVARDGALMQGVHWDTISSLQSVQAVANRQLLLQQPTTVDEQQHYLMSLRAMLLAMQRTRGDAPYGHIQQLSVYVPEGAILTPAQQSLVASALAPLAAHSSVWTARDKAVVKCRFAVYSSIQAIKVSAQEAEFWNQVVFKPFFLGEKAPLVFVDKSLGHITCCVPSQQGTFLAVGTALGAVLVYDVRNQPNNPWFQVTGAARGPASRGSDKRSGQPPGTAPSVLSLAWSANGYQLACLDAAYSLRVWTMKPAPGQAVGEEPNRQPVQPTLALSMQQANMCASGKAVLADMMDDLSTHRPLHASSWSCTFALDMTVLGCQPAVVVPQATGDLVKVTTSTWDAPLLPKPIAHSASSHTIASKQGSIGPHTTQQGTRSVNSGSHTSTSGTHVTQGEGMTSETADYLLQPEVSAPGVSSQCLYRAHDSQVVYVGYLGDGATLVSVDRHGVIHCWPAEASQRSGFGWHTPTCTWRLPRTIKAYQARGPGYPVWPTVPTRSVPLPRAPRTGGGFFGFGRKGNAAEDTGSTHISSVQSGLPPSHQDYRMDTDMHDTDDEVSLLDQDPTGQWLSDTRLPWLVQYQWDTEEDKKGRLIRREIRRPHPTMPPGKPLLVTRTVVPSGQLVSREKQAAVLARMDYRVVSASVAHESGDLVIWVHLSPSPSDRHSFGVLSAHVINTATAHPITPRIDVFDHSNGTCAPAYALSPSVHTLGSEYLFVGLGCGVVGVYSVATGQLSRELYLGMPTTSPHFASLALFQINPAQGTCRNQGKTILAAIPSDSLYVHLFEINDELGKVETVLKRPQPQLVRVLPHPGLLKQPSNKDTLSTGLARQASNKDTASGGQQGARLSKQVSDNRAGVAKQETVSSDRASGKVGL